jgi:hypothetical protein
MIVVSLCIELVESCVGLSCFRIFEALVVLVEHFFLVILLVEVKRAIETVIF